MKKILLIIYLLLVINISGLYSQTSPDTTVFLLTCGPGTETYSIYGHSALRVVISDKHSDTVYNWGVFDFDTPNFVWKFAKGRLDYLLVEESLDRFLQDYFYEQRFVYSQKINLSSVETERLVKLINENLKPENVSYRYDFFYDDCSTRIRDLLEKSIGTSLLYPPPESEKSKTFRDMVAKYQNPYPWLNFGIDLIMGSPGDKQASYRDRMFLPIDMQNELVDARIKRDGSMIPLLQNPEVLLNFNSPDVRQKLYSSPIFIFTLLLIVIVIISAMLKSRKANNVVDLVVYSVFSILALMMIFFNFFTDHQQMKWNLNIIWLNPFLLFCLGALILKKDESIWYRIVFIISMVFLVIHFFLPQDFNNAVIPLVLIIIFRSSVRAGFEWNPFTLK